MGRSNQGGATLKKQSRRYVNPDATQTDLGLGAQPVRPAPSLAEFRSYSETRILIGWNRARRSLAQCLPAFVIIPRSSSEASGERAGCADGDSEPDSPVSTPIVSH